MTGHSYSLTQPFPAELLNTRQPKFHLGGIWYMITGALLHAGPLHLNIQIVGKDNTKIYPWWKNSICEFLWKPLAPYFDYELSWARTYSWWWSGSVQRAKTCCLQEWGCQGWLRTGYRAKLNSNQLLNSNLVSNTDSWSKAVMIFLICCHIYREGIILAYNIYQANWGRSSAFTPHIIC